MIAVDLMVGDLVMFHNGIDQVQEIYGLAGNVYLKEYGTIDVNKLSPIPITDEILKKNGFIKHADYCWLISENNGRRLIEYRTDYLDGLLRISYAEEPFSKLMIKVKYVHELQHALRLCGINKEIEI